MIEARDLEGIIARIVALYDPDSIYLFGSYAKGTMTERSDLDFIVVKATSDPPRMRGRDVIAILAEVPVAVDLIFLTPEELEAEVGNDFSLIGTVFPSALELYTREAGTTPFADAFARQA